MASAFRWPLTVALLATVALARPAPLAAQTVAGAATDAVVPAADYGELDLETLLDQKVTTATKTAQKVTEAPANIRVINADEIQRAGYRSVAEALEVVPGLALNTDHVFTNVGVRGISGGLRSGSRHIKLLINGQPAAFRPDAQNLLGPELVPIEAVDRIEVIRGPASALYGRNAFLGVVNVVTKEAAGGAEYAIRGSAGSIREGLSTGGELLLMDRAGPLSFTLAGSLGREDRSRLTLPAGSVLYDDFNGNFRSRDDIARPMSLFASASLDLGKGGTLRLDGSFQNLDAAAEFLDYGALSHVSRIHLRNGFGRLRYSVTLGRVDLEAYVAGAAGAPGPSDVILPVVDGSPTSQLVERDFGYLAIDAGLEGRVSLFKKSLLLAGVEYGRDVETTRTNIFVSPSTGQQQRGPSFGDVNFDNVGVYGQALVAELGPVQLVGNARVDHHNIFGTNFNYRGAAVYAPFDGMVIKLLSGSSYRPPTPEQLYGTPIRPGGVEGALAAVSGTQDLAPQRARSHEVSLGYTRGKFQVQLDGYFTSVDDRIEYLLREGTLQPANLSDSQTVGGELSARNEWSRPFKGYVIVSLDGSLSLQRTSITLPIAQSLRLTAREHDGLEVNELYPDWMLKWGLNIRLPRLYVNLNLRMSVYGARLESQSNQALGRPFNGSPRLEIPISYPLHAVLSSVGLKLWGEHETRVQIIANDLLDTSSPEPGFTGIQIPALGRRVMLLVRQAL